MARATEQSIEERLAVIRLAREEMQLEIETEQVETLRAKRLERHLNRERQRQTIAEQERNSQIEQSNCNHKKGGSGLESMHDGDDTKYAVVKHTYPHGAREVMCMRCQKIWAEPSTDLRKTDLTEYKRQLKGYQEALRFPTDNKESGKQLFVILRAAA